MTQCFLLTNKVFTLEVFNPKFHFWFLLFNKIYKNIHKKNQNNNNKPTRLYFYLFEFYLYFFSTKNYALLMCYKITVWNISELNENNTFLRWVELTRNITFVWASESHMCMVLLNFFHILSFSLEAFLPLIFKLTMLWPVLNTKGGTEIMVFVLNIQ